MMPLSIEQEEHGFHHTARGSCTRPLRAVVTAMAQLAPRVGIFAPLLLALVLLLAFGKNTDGRALKQQQQEAVAKAAGEHYSQLQLRLQC